MFSRLAAVMLVVLLVAASGDAADKKTKKTPDDAKTDPEKILKQLDGNSDGFLTIDEFNFLPNVMLGTGKATPAALAAAFAKLDTDKNKKLSLEEFKKVKELGLAGAPAKGAKKKKKTA